MHAQSNEGVRLTRRPIGGYIEPITGTVIRKLERYDGEGHSAGQTVWEVDSGGDGTAIVRTLAEVRAFLAPYVQSEALRRLHEIVAQAEYSVGPHTSENGWTNTPLGRRLGEAEAFLAGVFHAPPEQAKAPPLDAEVVGGDPGTVEEQARARRDTADQLNSDAEDAQAEGKSEEAARLRAAAEEMRSQAEVLDAYDEEQAGLEGIK